MASQKRKVPHDAGAERSVSDAPARRSTRQHPAAAAEPVHQSRSGRIRVNSIEKPDGRDVARSASCGRNTDAPKQRAAASADPAVATIPSTRATRHNKVATSADTGVGIAPMLIISKENIRPPTPPDDGGKHLPPVEPKLSRHYHHARRRSRTRSRSPSRSTPRSTPRRPSSNSQSHTIAPRSSQRPADPAPRATTVTAKPPGTPRSDRNIDEVVFGNTCFKAWYPSYYGREVLGDVATNAGANAKIGGGKRDQPLLDRLYVCPCCFKYSKELIPWWKHVQYCEKRGYIPGTKIYTHPRHSKSVRVPDTSSATTNPSTAAKGKGKSKSVENGQLAGATVGEGEWSVWEVDGGKDGVSCLRFL